MYVASLLSAGSHILTRVGFAVSDRPFHTPLLSFPSLLTFVVVVVVVAVVVIVALIVRVGTGNVLAPRRSAARF